MSDIKKHFISRFEDGVIIEADFDQLEIRVLAYLSQDETLMSDILSGRDMHRWRASELFGVPEDKVTSEQRRAAKSLSFQLQYGAGPKSMSEKLELPKDLCKKFVENFYNRYPKVKQTQDLWISTVNKNRVTIKERSKKGFPIGRSKLVSVTGREYVFTETDAPDFLVDRGTPTSFTPTDIKNYGVQGLATGDLVPLARSKLLRRLLAEGLIWDKVLPIMTVHDSIMFDSRGTYVEQACRIIKHEMESTPKYFKEVFGIEFNLPLPCEIKVGRNWLELEKWHELPK